MATISGPLPPDRRLILIRHGRTAWNAEGRFTTRTDVPLDAEGREQAARAGAALAGVRIDRILASPLERARHTAEAIAAARADGELGVTVDPRLTEIDAGPFEGRTIPEIEAGRDAAAFRAWHADADVVEVDGAEPLAAAAARAGAFLADAAALPGTTLAVTHGSLVRVLVAAAVLGADPAAHRRLWLDHCHWAVVETDGGRPRVTAFNIARPDDA
jgi:broad specificity phosphatase PhoE